MRWPICTFWWMRSVQSFSAEAEISCFFRRLSKGVEYLVEASAAEAEAISAALAAAKARQTNGELEQLPERDGGADATPSGKQLSSLVKVSDSAVSNNVTPTTVRLHHRAVSHLP